MSRKLTLVLLLTVAALIGVPGALAATSVDYSTTIQPVFDASCTGCHSGSSPSAGIDLTSYNNVIAATFNGTLIVTPGNATNSTLYQAVSGTGTVEKMPPSGSLTTAQIQSIADWINQGALSTTPSPTSTLTTIMVSPPTATLNAGATQMFTATALDQNNTPMAGVNITWTSSNTTVGTVNPSNATTDLNGTATTTFTALAAGTAMVNATNGNVSGSATVTVIVPLLVNGTIAGTVTNASSGLAIPGATVTADNMTATTDINGSYNISIAPGTYNVTASATGYQSNTTTGAVVTSGNVTTQNFALTPVTTFNISGFKINDTNGNGVWDQGEMGIENWNIMLLNDTGAELANTSTNAQGFYQFMNIFPGNYSVAEEVKSGFTPTNATSIPVTVENMDVTNVNFTNKPVIVPTFSISGFKINGTDNNGMGIENWNIMLLNPDTGAEIANTTTDSMGFYKFSNLTNGTYNVTEGMMTGWTNVSAMSQIITISGADVMNVNFTNALVVPPQATFSISGFKINNATGEGIPGWNITLTNSTMQTTTTTTDRNGFYEFTGLVNGTYNVSEEMKPGFTPVGDTFHVETIAGQDITNVNFTNQPIVPTFSISGFKINGTDNNGMGIENWNIMLLNPDTGALIANTTTDSMGFYKFSNLTNGTYNVTEVMMAGWMNISAMSQIITISGADVMNVNFTNALVIPPQATFSISGFKINNATGEGIPGWNITLTNSMMQTTTTTTDRNGFYEFTGLVNGTYNVSEEMRPGFTPVGDTFHVETIAGQDITDVNFTNTPTPVSVTGSISGFKINAANGMGLQGWTIRLIGIVGKETGTNVIRMDTTTGADGSYMFDNLPAGRYIIREELQRGFVPVGPPVKNIVLEQGENSMNNNFTNKPIQSLVGVENHKDTGNNKDTEDDRDTEDDKDTE